MTAPPTVRPSDGAYNELRCRRFYSQPLRVASSLAREDTHTSMIAANARDAERRRRQFRTRRAGPTEARHGGRI